MGHYEFTEPMIVVGSWKLPGSNVYLHSSVRPRWLTRVLVKWLLEIEWVDGV